VGLVDPYLSLVAFQSSGGLLPTFQIRERTVMDRSLRSWGHNAADQDLDQDFTTQFSLSCANSGEKREFFTARRHAHIRRFAGGFEIQSSRNWLLICRPGQVIS
jgi:hypothetical protein